MSVIGSNILAGASGQAGYFLTKSLRFRSSASAYLNRTFGTPTNNKIFTLSAWIKVGTIPSSREGIFVSVNGALTSYWGLEFNASAGLTLYDINAGGASLVTTQVFRDLSSWYHIVVAIDTTQATASNRAKIYINGTQITSFSAATYPAQNSSPYMNTSGNIGYFANWSAAGALYFDGYLAEVNFIDGQALTPSSFGETSTTTGVWIPKKYTGTYGTNGFYLPFTDTASTSTLGTDFSGNSNTWTVNNISLTAGSTYDSMTDVPTLTSATTANYAVFNPLVGVTNTTLSNGNLTFTKTGNSDIVLPSTIAMPSGKFYWETTLTSVSASSNIGLGLIQQDAPSAATGTWPGASDAAIVLFGGNGNLYVNGTSSSGTGLSLATNDVVGLALDMSAATLAIYKNGSLVYTATSLVVTKPYLALFDSYGNGESQAVNFGQRPFAYTPPAGFVALNTFNLTTPTIGATASSQANEYMDVSIWSGDNAGTRNITNSGSMQPDWVWVKRRNGAADHVLFDAVRGFGGNKELSSNTTGAEGALNTSLYGYVSAANSNGFQLTAGSTDSSYTNRTSDTYVGWQWRASNTTPVTNTAGSITSTVSASTTAGFSVVTYTGNGSSGTVGHGLGVAPSMIIVKSRSTAQRWTVFHTSTSNAYIYLNETFAADTTNANLRFGDNTVVVQPTSTVFSIGNSVDVNQNTTTYVAYCFAPIAGYSAFGSYTGNGSTDGPFVFTGFRPRFVMVKCSSSDQGGNAVWGMFDTSRNAYNVANNRLIADLSNSESTSPWLDINSNGFKIRETSTSINGSGATYIYMAFAENPFKYANAR